MTTPYVDGHPEPAVDFDYDAIDRGNPLAAEISGASTHDKLVTVTEKFRRVIQEIHSARNSKKAARTFLIATGDESAQGEKITHAAKEFGVSKQDISKCCVDWCKFMGIEPSSYMRSFASKESFRKSNKRKPKQ